MKKISGVKYITSAITEFQPGSKNQVLKNLRGIATVREIDKAEFAGYMTAERKVIEGFTKDQRLTMNDIHQINKWFLGDVFSWAGTIRTVNIS